MNPEQAIFLQSAFLSFFYALVPAVLVLWFLLARRRGSVLLAPMCGFIFAMVLTIPGGKVNDFLGGVLENKALLFLVLGFNEELIKFVASVLGLIVAVLLVRGLSWQSMLSNNWLAIGLSGALGFAAGENFIYGISGQGSIARLLPMISHCFFACFWCIALREAAGNDSNFQRLRVIVMGLIQGTLLHAIYNCSVDPDLLKPIYRVLCCLLVPSAVWSLWWIKGRRLSTSTTEPVVIIAKPNKKNIITSQPSFDRSIAVILSLVCPGLGHMLFRREFFNGLTFLLLSVCLPVSLLLFAFRFAKQMNIEIFGESGLIVALMLFLGAYFIIGMWSAWEVTLKEKRGLADHDSKRRFSAIFPLSTLLMVSVSLSFFLPSRLDESDDSDELTVKEISLGLNWGVEEKQSIIREISVDDEALQVTSEESSNMSQNNYGSNRLDIRPDPAGQGYIGILLSVMLGQQTQAYVHSVFMDTSAAKVGLKPRDIITTVNGKSTRGLSVVEVSQMIVGPIGTYVELTVDRPGVGILTFRPRRTGSLLSIN